jgi:hypothetical protein
MLAGAIVAVNADPAQATGDVSLGCDAGRDTATQPTAPAAHVDTWELRCHPAALAAVAANTWACGSLDEDRED